MLIDNNELSPWPEGVDRLHYPELGSTMAQASLLGPSLSRPTWIVADRQTEGRGRQGRVWSDGTGNLHATLFYRPDITPAHAALRSFMAANALLETFAAYVPRSSLSVKWPNDILLNQGKVAGILLESAGGQKIDWLAIGFGVNLASAPNIPGARFAPVALNEKVARTVAPAEFLGKLAVNFAEQEHVMETQGFERIRNNWLRRAAKLGNVITARTGKREITGTFETIDEEGALVLRASHGPVILSAAEVYF